MQRLVYAIIIAAIVVTVDVVAHCYHSCAQTLAISLLLLCAFEYMCLSVCLHLRIIVVVVCICSRFAVAALQIRFTPKN